MIRSLWTAASGMIGEQTHIDVISNNLSNVNTNGFKQQRAEFEDLLYQEINHSTLSKEDTVNPRPIQIGLGVKVAATQRIFEQGSLKQTQLPLDLALSGNGFFQITLPSGEKAYTRDGSFKIDATRRVLTSNGYKLGEGITLPEGANLEDLKISAKGLITARIDGSNEYVEVGQIRTYTFVNPAGLHATGDNLFKETQASGPPFEGTPSVEGQPTIIQGFLENSNVKMVDAMVDMITAQRSYQFSSKAVTTSDNMLQTAINMKR